MGLKNIGIEKVKFSSLFQKGLILGNTKAGLGVPLRGMIGR